MEEVAIPSARVMRIIWFGFVLAGVMLIYIVIAIPAQAPRPMDPTVALGLTIIALVDVALGFFMPRILRRFAKQARQGLTRSAALNAWFRDNLIGLTWVYSCNLFAFALHFIGARAGLVELLFGVGMTSLLLWRPSAPPAGEPGTLTRG